MYTVMVNGTRYKFGLSRQEVMKIEFDSLPVQFSRYLNSAIADLDFDRLDRAFKIILIRSFKGPGSQKDFANSDDFRCLFKRLAYNPDRAKKFMLHILPENTCETEVLNRKSH